MFKVSVILACYNVEDYIDDALSTIVRQSAFKHFQVIPVNDGSTDRTWEIIQRYQRQYPDNFFPISFDKGSGGPGKPRNAGLDAATAEYVIFMDPDDRIYKDGYSKLLAAIEKHGSDVVIGTRYGVEEKQGPESKVWVDWIAERPFVNQDNRSLKLELLAHKPVILKTIYRRDMIERHSLRFLEGVTSSEDEIFDMKYLLLSKKITKINDLVYLYTAERTGSITSKIRLKVYEDLEVIFHGLHDSLSVYFEQPIISHRLASLIRAFYLPKLANLDPNELDEALELIRHACDSYGFDRLLVTSNGVDRQLVELLRDRRYIQLVMLFMQQRVKSSARRARASKAQLAELERAPVKVAVKASKAADMTRVAIRERAFAKIYATRVRKNLAGEPNGYWLFGDRRDKGSDNGEALYRYVRDNQLHDKIAFIIRRDCPDWRRLEADGFNLVAYGTLAHWRLLYNCEHFFTSHVDDVIIQPWTEYGAARGKPSYKLNFLQHGIIRSDLSSWLGAKQYHTFCSAARPEYDALLKNPAYNLGPQQLKLTGLARHDLLEAAPGDYILISPTWRSFLLGANELRFKASDFYQAWHALIYDPRVRDALTAAGKHVKLVLHSSIGDFAPCFEPAPHVQVMKYNDVASFADLLSHAQLLVTDYSTISFDVAYLRRPVVYYTFRETLQHSTNASADLDLYARLGHLSKQHDDAVADIVAAIERGFTVDEDRAREAEQFFAFGLDRQNCKRIIDAATGDGS